MSNTRQPVELQQEVAQHSAEVAQLRHAVDAMTADIALFRTHGLPHASAAPVAAAPAAATQPSRGGAQSFAIHAPRLDPLREKVVLPLKWRPTSRRPSIRTHPRTIRERGGGGRSRSAEL